MRIHHATLAKAKKFNITLSVEENEVVAMAKDGTRLASGLQGNKVLEDAITKATGKPAKGSAPKAPKAAKVESPASYAETLCKEEGWKKTRWGFRKDGEEAPEATTWEELVEELGLTEGVEDEVDDESDADQGKSIVKAKYKALYKPHKDKSGDDLSFKINEHVSREDDETGEMRIDLNALRNFAQANDCWVESYSRLRSRTGGWNAGMARMNVANRLRAKIRQAKKDGKEFKIKWA